MPAAAYKALRASGLSVNEPKVLTGRHVFQSSRQITTKALCSGCEECFNRSGEAWVVDKLATLNGFPLRNMVRASSPLSRLPAVPHVGPLHRGKLHPSPLRHEHHL
jgi:hypothetical protein